VGLRGGRKSDSRRVGGQRGGSDNSERKFSRTAKNKKHRHKDNESKKLHKKKQRVE
jgi:hypothetical protein